MIFENKRGLSMVFVIAGIVIVIIAGLVVFFTAEDVQIGRRISTTQVEPVREYIESCIEEKMNELLPRLRLYGGWSGFVYPLIRYHDGYVYQANILGDSMFDGTFVPQNNRDLENTIRFEIASHFVNSPDCFLVTIMDRFDLQQTRQVDFNEDLKITVNPNNIFITFEFPFVLKKGDVETSIGRIVYERADNLGEYNEFAVEFIERVDSQLLEGKDLDEAYDIVYNIMRTANNELNPEQSPPISYNFQGVLKNFKVVYLRTTEDLTEGRQPYTFAVRVG